MSKKSSSETKPWKKAEPYVLGAGNTLSDAYNQNSGRINEVTDQVTGLIPGLIDRFNQGDAGVGAAKDYTSKVLGGQFLDAGNPYIQKILDRTGNEVKNQSQAALGVRGLTGGSDYANIISRNLADNASNILYGDYNAERGRMSEAAGMQPALASADYLPINSILNAGSFAGMPLDAASQYAQGIGGLFGPYSKTTQKQGAGTILGGLLGSGLSGWASGGFAL